MFPIVGLVVVFGMVFGGFVLAGGHFEVLIEAAPMEFMMIGGAALGALIIWAVGFSHVEAIHNAAHDTRHSHVFPCH